MRGMKILQRNVNKQLERLKINDNFKIEDLSRERFRIIDTVDEEKTVITSYQMFVWLDRLETLEQKSYPDQEQLLDAAWYLLLMSTARRNA